MGDESEARLGTRLGNYALKEIIGRGGMGVVYRAEHIYLHRPAAVKMLHRRLFDHTEARERFLREAQTASVVEHPHIVGVTDFGEADDGTVFLVMAHVEGTSLDRVLRHEEHLPLFRAVGILGQVTRGLAAAHAKGVVHRDLKPENIMLAERPGRRQVVRDVDDARGKLEIVEVEDRFDWVTILDFGAAKFWQQSMSPSEQGAAVVGTPVYMAPETARTGIADARSDIYAVGVIFYEMLTGTVPFDGETAVDIMMKHVHELPDPPSRRNRDVEITPEAERVILKALEKDPDRRQRSMDELHADLQRCYGRVRFRRSNVAVPGGGVESLRAPIPLTAEKRKRPGQPTPADTRTLGGAVPAAATPPGKRETPSSPILLTKRKSGKHRTLPFGVPAEGEGAGKGPGAAIPSPRPSPKGRG